MALGTRGASRHIDDMKKQDDTPRDPSPMAEKQSVDPAKPREIGGPKGPEPTRYGDWEVGGRCSDF
jgi:hypothetical protein